MREGIHPNYREVCFVDLSNGFKFVTRSCVNTKETVKMDDGRELPLFKLDTSSESPPFYTGTQKSVDNMGGPVVRFRNRFPAFSFDAEISAEVPADHQIRLEWSRQGYRAVLNANLTDDSFQIDTEDPDSRRMTVFRQK